jgi:hypothetical protein
MGSKIYTHEAITSQDMRTAVGGNVDNLVAAGSAVGGSGGGTVVAGQGATVTQTTSGMTGSDVTGMLDQFMDDRSAERETFASLGESLAGGLQAQGQQLAETLAATKAPDSTTLATLMPVLIIVGLVLALATLKR